MNFSLETRKLLTFILVLLVLTTSFYTTTYMGYGDKKSAIVFPTIHYPKPS